MAKNSQNRADSQKSEPSEIDGNPQARKQSRRGSNSDPIQSAEGTNFLVVGIGASAGGVQALKMFFTNVPADSGNAYVVILHLSPDHESHLAEILYSTAGMPVTQVIDSRVRVEPNHIYVISPNHGLEMTDGYLEGTPVESQQERRAPVDLFFRTLAESRAESAVSVILSGTGPDGSMGVKRIKEMGGIVIAQDPEEAQYRDMPRYSIRTGLVDFILPVAEIPAKINEYRSRVGKALIAVAPEETPNEVEENVLADILLLLRTRSGHDFTNYKRATVLRRVERRMNVQGKSTLSEYAEFLREHDQESHALLKDLLISVTNFFRDADAFHLLEKEILPKILDNKSIKDPVRAWVPACATGEEAYSFAMLFAEQTSKRLNVPLVQIFATDIDEEAIVHARSGLYSEPDVADVSPARLQQFFQREGANYRVRREIREMVLFATHNVLKDPPFSRLELVSCRNLLIYLNSSAQKQLVEMAHFALKPGGYLFLGSSESVEGASDLFRPISKEFRVFQGRPISQRLGVRVPELSPAIARNHIASAPGEKTAEVHAIERLSFAALHQNLLEEYAAPSLVVNDEYEIVHVSPRAGRYLQIIGGEPSNNLLNIARPELRLELRTALYQGAQRGIPVSVRGVPVKTEDGLETVNLVVRPVTGPDNPNRGFMLVIFEPAKENEHNEALPMPSDVEPIAKQLEKELVFLKSKLSSTVEQYEIQQEELKASNEELQAINEELRSSGEELEMSREELQSVNEELSTVNQELKIKIEELSQSNNDFQNLINSTSVGTIFLDRQMRVNLFTETASEIFNLIPGDIGRPLLDLRSSLQFIDLVEDVQLVLKNLERVEREVSSSDGRHYLMRIMPYRSDQDRIDGVVMAFVDITSLKNSEDELLLAKERLLQALNIPTVGVIFFDNQTRFTGCNDTFLLMTGYGRTDIESGRLTWKTLIPPEWKDDAQKAIRQLENPGYVPPYEKEYIRKDGSRFYGLFAAARVNADEIVEYVIDISESKQAEKELKFRSRLLDTVQQSIIATDLHGNVIYWNRQAEQMFGWKADEVMGKNIAGITVPKYSAGEAGEIMSRVKGGESWDGEFELTRRDGTTFQAHVFNSPVRDRNGNVTGIVGVSIDLSQRKETEEALRESNERLRMVVQSATDYAIFTLNEGNTITSWSPGAEGVFGYKEDEIIGRSAEILFTSEDRANEVPRKEMECARETGKAEDERWHVRKDGSRFYASGVMQPLRDRSKGFVKICRDQTVKRRADTIVKEKDMLQQLVSTQEDERRRIARDIHDHLGQQMTSLRLKLESVKEMCHDTKICDEIEEAQKTAEQLDRDVDFLAWELRPAALDDLGLRITLGNFVKEWSRYGGIAAEFHTSGIGKGRLAFEIETNLYRIAQEALNNIFKHAKAKSVSVLLEKRGSAIKMIIEDDGVGFKPMSSKTISRGLGLSGMRERASILGGDLDIESSPGKGTTIYVKVPARFQKETE